MIGKKVGIYRRNSRNRGGLKRRRRVCWEAGGTFNQIWGGSKEGGRTGREILAPKEGSSKIPVVLSKLMKTLRPSTVLRS